MQVHIILGIGSLSDIADGSSSFLVGTMADAAASPNDPIFINHHAMLDYIFEEWLQRQDSPSYEGPTNSLFPGHAAGDCAVPFIPVYTHSNIFQSADHFGYYYAGPESTDDSGTSSDSGSILEPFLLVTVISLLSLLLIVFLY